MVLWFVNNELHIIPKERNGRIWGTSLYLRRGANKIHERIYLD
jgi:hypothetical protein